MGPSDDAAAEDVQPHGEEKKYAHPGTYVYQRPKADWA